MRKRINRLGEKGKTSYSFRPRGSETESFPAFYRERKISVFALLVRKWTKKKKKEKKRERRKKKETKKEIRSCWPGLERIDTFASLGKGRFA